MLIKNGNRINTTKRPYTASPAFALKASIMVTIAAETAPLIFGPKAPLNTPKRPTFSAVKLLIVKVLNSK